MRTAPALRDATLAVLADLVAFPTVTGTSNLELIGYAEERLSAVGAATVTTYDAGRRRANLLATIGPAVDGGVLLSGHTDVVPAEPEGWTSDPFAATLRGGHVFGRGTADMKGFLACAVAAAPELAAGDLRAPLHLAFTYDEEVGCEGAPGLIAELLRTGPRPAAAIVGEPTSMRIVHGHKGCYEYTTTITGAEGHGSAPDKACNAVEWGARYVARLLELRDALAARADAGSGYDPPGTTINVGTFHGGTARNVAAGTCTIEWEMRPVRTDDARLVLDDIGAFEATLAAELAAASPGAGIVRSVAGEVGGLEPDGDPAAVQLLARLLDDPEVGVVPFGTEAGLYQAAGIPAVVCGPGSIDVAHQPDEHVSLDQLDRCLELLQRLAAELSTPMGG